MKNHQLTLARKTHNKYTTNNDNINKNENNNMKVTVIPIVIGALGTGTKGLVQRLEDLEIRR